MWIGMEKAVLADHFQNDVLCVVCEPTPVRALLVKRCKIVDFYAADRVERI